MKRKNGRSHGEVFTDKNAVQFILDEVEYFSEYDLSNIKILEPASGKGAFANEIIKRLFKSSEKYNFLFMDCLVRNVTLVELNRDSFLNLCNSIDELVFQLTNQKSNVSQKICINTNFLTYNFPLKFDCIVGNPPYIRHEIIPESDKIIYRQKFSTFRYRSDLYIPFYENSLNLLKSDGLLSFICSNRWLYNQYGKILRQLISTNFNLKKILNIEKSSPFDETVTAYPCITTIQNNVKSENVLFYEDNSKIIDFDNIQFTEVENPTTYSWQNLFLNYNINHIALMGVEDQAFEIGIGVATGADKVFIKQGKELNGIEKSRLLPLVKSSDLKNNTFNWKENYLINPYDIDGLCDLKLYPHLQNYFNENKDILLKRHVVKKAPNNWYKTIDRIKPELLTKPKLLLPDLTGNKFLFIDEGKYYPHHNIYYITGENISSLKILGSILMSDFIKYQMSQIGIRMNGGLPRFQSQVLKQLKIPNIKNLSSIEKAELIKGYDTQNLNITNNIIKKYCIQHGFGKMADSVLN